MSSHVGTSLEPLRRPGGGTGVALALFALISWWGLWSAAVEHSTDLGPSGFDWFGSLALTGIAVSRWLARYGAKRLARTPPRKVGLFGSGDAFGVGFALVVPGSACWFAVRAVTAHRREAGNHWGYSMLWLLWAFTGTTGQVVFPWSDAVFPATVLFAASMLNVGAMAALMFLEPALTRHGSRRVRIADGTTC